ncbi:MAG: hypothetical protein NVSMB32_17460 [Actinomycetota bacterium]
MNVSDAVSGAVRAAPGGAELAVFCQPKAARSAIVGMHGGQLKAKVQAPPVAGKANAALSEMLAGVLGVARRQVQVISGEQSRIKRVLVQGLAPGVMASLLADHLKCGQLEFPPTADATASSGAPGGGPGGSGARTRLGGLDGNGL